MQKKLAPCRRMISSAKKIRAAKISALSAAVYNTERRHQREKLEPPRAKIMLRVPKNNKIPSTILVK
jgi:hypothetical protein